MQEILFLRIFQDCKDRYILKSGSHTRSGDLFGVLKLPSFKCISKTRDVYRSISHVFFSVLVLGVGCVLAFIIKNFFSKRVKIAYVSVILALLALAGSHLYFAIMISTLKDYLLNQLTLCQNSPIFAELYWSYLKIESVCSGSIENCACLSDSSCSSPMIQAFYLHFQCDGLCGTGNKDCSGDISSLITKIGAIFAGVTSLSFVFLMISTGLTVCLIKKRMSERSIIEIRAKNLQSFDGVIERERADMPSIAEENRREENEQIEDLSKISKIENASNADASEIVINF